MQDEKTNFNANIFLQIDRRVWSPKESFSLQEKISVGIARTLESYLKIEGITIHYPFHFLYHQGKVAGHLIQTCNTADGIAMRIGVGINTDFAPELPENDELVKYIYKSPTSLGMKPDDWGDLYRRLRYNILECLSMESCHEPYKNFLTVKAGHVVQMYRDSGTIQLGKPLTHAMVMEITEEGNLVMDDGKTYNTEHHVQTN